MADLSITAASVLASAQAVVRREYNFGTTVTAGQLVYLDTTNKWQLCDADASSAGNALTDLRGIALNGGASGQPAAVCQSDPDFTPGATLTQAVTYYMSNTAGAITNVVPTTGWYNTLIFIAKSTTKADFNPVSSGSPV